MIYLFIIGWLALAFIGWAILHGGNRHDIN
jgi:hypothetical protein